MPLRPRPIVAIDGPAGAGKSTVARRLADELEFLLVDTGAMYRAVALQGKRKQIDWNDGPAMGALTEALVRDEAIGFSADAARMVRTHLYGEDISSLIRTPEIASGASLVSTHAEVRKALLDMQRQTGKAGGVVLEGRDIGTVVFPDAESKFFLTASPEIRARRRYQELVQKGETVTFESTLADVMSRDAQDTGRAHAPLKQADDATLVDSSFLTLEETVAKIAQLVRARISQG